MWDRHCESRRWIGLVGVMFLVALASFRHAGKFVATVAGTPS